MQKNALTIFDSNDELVNEDAPNEYVAVSIAACYANGKPATVEFSNGLYLEVRSDGFIILRDKYGRKLHKSDTFFQVEFEQI